MHSLPHSMSDDDYPVTPESIKRAQDACEAERQASGLPLDARGFLILPDDPRDPPHVVPFPVHHEPTTQERHAAMLALSDMVDAFGLETVSKWLRTLATMHGRTL